MSKTKIFSIGATVSFLALLAYAIYVDRTTAGNMLKDMV